MPESLSNPYNWFRRGAAEAFISRFAFPAVRLSVKVTLLVQVYPCQSCPVCFDTVIPVMVTSSSPPIRMWVSGLPFTTRL